MTEIRDEIETLKRIPGIINKFIKDVPLEKLDIKWNEDAWTIREHYLHIVQVQDMLLGRIRLIKENDEPVIEPYFPENDSIDILDMDDAADRYKEYRQKQLDEILSCSDEQLLKKAVHKEYSEYSIPIIVKHMIFHEYWHMYRIEELLYTKDEFFK